MSNQIKFSYTLIRSTINLKVNDNNCEEHFFIDLQ